MSSHPPSSNALRHLVIIIIAAVTNHDPQSPNFALSAYDPSPRLLLTFTFSSPLTAERQGRPWGRRPRSTDKRVTRTITTSHMPCATFPNVSPLKPFSFFCQKINPNFQMPKVFPSFPLAKQGQITAEVVCVWCRRRLLARMVNLLWGARYTTRHLPMGPHGPFVACATPKLTGHTVTLHAPRLLQSPPSSESESTNIFNGQVLFPAAWYG